MRGFLILVLIIVLVLVDTSSLFLRSLHPRIFVLILVGLLFFSPYFRILVLIQSSFLSSILVLILYPGLLVLILSYLCSHPKS